MIQRPIKPITLEDFLQLPETKPAKEYINGQIVQKDIPEADYGIVQTDLATAINNALKPSQQGRAITGLRCTFGDSDVERLRQRSIVPDITVLPWAAVPRNNSGKASGELLTAPHWMIEILSAGQSQTKIIKKILHAMEHGTQLGWLVDPAEECVLVYTPDLSMVLYEDPAQLLPVTVFAQGFRLTVGELVAWLYE